MVSSLDPQPQVAPEPCMRPTLVPSAGLPAALPLLAHPAPPLILLPPLLKSPGQKEKGQEGWGAKARAERSPRETPCDGPGRGASPEVPLGELGTGYGAPVVAPVVSPPRR